MSSVSLWQINREINMAATKVGFIGLGRMGLPMSYRLLAAGFDLTVHNRSQSKVQEIASDGARASEWLCAGK